MIVGERHELEALVVQPMNHAQIGHARATQHISNRGCGAVIHCQSLSSSCAASESIALSSEHFAQEVKTAVDAAFGTHPTTPWLESVLLQ